MIKTLNERQLMAPLRQIFRHPRNSRIRLGIGVKRAIFVEDNNAFYEGGEISTKILA